MSKLYSNTVNGVEHYITIDNDYNIVIAGASYQKYVSVHIPSDEIDGLIEALQEAKRRIKAVALK